MARKKAEEKRPRRKPGTGLIRTKKGRAKPFEACFTLEGAEPRYESFQSYEDAAAWLDKLAEEKEKGTRDLVGGAMLVQDYLPMWLGLKKPHIGPKTYEAYQYYCEYSCGEGGLGRLRIEKVTHIIGQTMINRLAEDEFKNTSQLKSVLVQAFDYAVDPLEYLTKNPFRKVKVPPIERKEGIALTKAERGYMLQMAAEDDQTPVWLTDMSDERVAPRNRKRTRGAPAPLCPFWHLTSRLAFRRGEASSLRWSNVDLENATVTIASTRGRLGNTHIEGKTKTKKPRTAPLPADMVEMFRAFKTTQMRAALANGWKWTEGGHVFVDTRDGTPISVDHLRYRWGRIKKASKIDPKMTIHDQRVTALTILALDGTAAAVRKKLSGHSTAKMDELYTSHAELEDVRRAVK